MCEYPFVHTIYFSTIPLSRLTIYNIQLHACMLSVLYTWLDKHTLLVRLLIPKSDLEYVVRGEIPVWTVKGECLQRLCSDKVYALLGTVTR